MSKIIPPVKKVSTIDTRKIFNRLKNLNQYQSQTYPKEFSGQYEHDVNILEIDQAILHKLETDREPAMKKCRELIEMERKNMETLQTIIDRRWSQQIVDQNQKTLTELESNFPLTTYKEKSKDILAEYQKIGPLPKIINLRGTITSPETPEQRQYRHNLISSYLEIARNYISINLVRNFELVNRCPQCGDVYADLIPEDNGLHYCQCGIERFQITGLTCEGDISKVATSKNDYEAKINFEKALLRKQGKQNIVIPEELFASLDKYFIAHRKPIGAEIKKLPLIDGRTKAGTGFEMMCQTLSEIGYPEYYEDVDLICHLYWGWGFFDFDPYLSAIMADYDAFEEEYRKLDIQGRTSSINVQYKLYQIIRRHTKCRFDDFKMVKTDHILQGYDEVFKQICSNLGWEFHATC